MPEVATPNQAEREFETGTDESFKNTSATAGAAHSENQRVTFANIKRTYDVYQDLDIQAARQALIEQTRVNQIASQALQNAVETANLVSKQAVRHGDIAIEAERKLRRLAHNFGEVLDLYLAAHADQATRDVDIEMFAEIRLQGQKLQRRGIDGDFGA